MGRGVHVTQPPLCVLVKEKVRPWPAASVILNQRARVGPQVGEGVMEGKGTPRVHPGWALASAVLAAPRV